MKADGRVKIMEEWFTRISGNLMEPLVISFGEINGTILEG